MVPRMRRLVALVLAAVVGLGGVLVLPAGPAGAAEGDGSDVSVARYGGPDRYSTSLLIAEAVAADAGGSLESVVLVSGERWTDAVVAAPIAGALGAPVLMTPPGELRADALEFLGRVGASAAVVIGPEAGGGSHGPGRGVSAAVLDALAEAGVSADRVAGSDRYNTSVAAAGQVTPGVMPSLGRTAIVASGEVFADALVAGPFAARGIHPVLLSAPDALPADVASYLGTAGIEHVVLMGGTAALSESVESAIRGLGVKVTRLAGTTRYDTAVKAAELVADRYSTAAGRACFTTGTIGLARARVPFDSFSAAPLLGRLCAPLVLADPKQIPADTAAYLDAARDANAAVDLRVFGGNAAVSQTALDAYLSGEDSDAGAAQSDDQQVEDAASDDGPGGLPAGAASDCKLGGLNDTTAGFPIPDWAAPSIGTLRVAVLFMDFPDARAGHTAAMEAELGVGELERYLEAMSYGKLDVQVVPHLVWLRADESYTRYVSEEAWGVGIDWRASEHAVDLADPEFDFSDIHAVMVVFPSTQFGSYGTAGYFVSADGATMTTSRVNTRLRGESPEQPDWVRRANSGWGVLAAHELAHNLGLLDLYPYDRGVHTRPAARSGKEWIRVEVGLMELNGYFLADESEMLRRTTVEYSDGYRYWWISSYLEIQEMLAWSRWQLGWLDDSQMRCITQPDATVTLTAIAQPHGRVAMAAVPLSNRRVIVVESRRKLGYDVGRPLTWPRGDTGNRRALLHEGVLVYTIDTLVATGQLPMRIAGDIGNGQVDDFPVLEVGESVTVAGYTITVTADDGDTHTVRITRDG